MGATLTGGSTQCFAIVAVAERADRGMHAPLNKRVRGSISPSLPGCRWQLLSENGLASIGLRLTDWLATACLNACVAAHDCRFEPFYLVYLAASLILALSLRKVTTTNSSTIQRTGDLFLCIVQTACPLEHFDAFQIPRIKHDSANVPS